MTIIERVKESFCDGRDLGKLECDVNRAEIRTRPIAFLSLAEQAEYARQFALREQELDAQRKALAEKNYGVIGRVCCVIANVLYAPWLED